MRSEHFLPWDMKKDSDRYIRDSAHQSCPVLLNTAGAGAPPPNRLLHPGWGGARHCFFFFLNPELRTNASAEEDWILRPSVPQVEHSVIYCNDLLVFMLANQDF